MRLRGSTAVVLCMLAGCFGTDTGNPPVAASLTARSSDPEVGVGAGVAPTVVETAWISVESVRVLLGEACDHVSEPVDRDVVGDVVRGFALDGVLDGPSCGLHVSLAVGPPLPAEAPSALSGRVLLVTGRRPDGAPFELSLDHLGAIDVVSAMPLALDEDTPVVIAFDVAPWLAGIDLMAIPLDGDGVARRVPTDPEAAALADGFATSVALYLDPDGDGHLGAAEEAAGPIATSHR